MNAAVSILNATATGRGAALAIEGGVEATWTWHDGPWAIEGAPDDRLVRATESWLRSKTQAPAGAAVATRSRFPPSRGLKTSSGAAAALLHAGAADLELALSEAELIAGAVAISRAAGVTLTGALDDQVAVVKGGCHLTDNHAGRVLEAIPTGPWHVAVWVPEAAISKSSIAGLDATPLRVEIEAAEQRLRDDDVVGAMSQNGAAFARLYMAAGLPITDEPVRAALAAGAAGAGLSGTGPAVAALFDDVADLPSIAGGTWEWSRSV